MSCSQQPRMPVGDSDNQFLEVEQVETEDSLAYIYKHRSTAQTGMEREQFIWDVLRLALEATTKDFGPYEMIGVDDINQIREDVELINDTGVITIISDLLNETNLEELDRINIPLLRNILGYRVFFINKDRQSEMRSVKDLDDLRKYSFGLVSGWNDQIILEHSGLEVYSEVEYEALYRSLEDGRYDIFSRGINEVQGEYRTYSEDYPNLHIEEDLLLFYPLPRYFWFSKSDQGTYLKKRVEIGLYRIINDGSFYKHFDETFLKELEALNLNKRRLIELENPIYSPEYDKKDQPYRYNPLME